MQTLKSQFALITTCCQEVSLKNINSCAGSPQWRILCPYCRFGRTPNWRNGAKSRIDSRIHPSPRSVQKHTKKSRFFVRPSFMTNHREEWLLRFMFDFVNFEKWVEWYGGEAEWSAFPGFGKFFRRGLQNVPSRAQKFTFCNYCLQHLKKLQLMFWIQNSFLWEKNSACKSIFIQHIWIMSIATTPFCEIYFRWFLNQQRLGNNREKVCTKQLSSR